MSTRSLTTRPPALATLTSSSRIGLPSPPIDRDRPLSPPPPSSSTSAHLPSSATATTTPTLDTVAIDKHDKRPTTITTTKKSNVLAPPLSARSHTSALSGLPSPPTPGHGSGSGSASHPLDASRSPLEMQLEREHSQARRYSELRRKEVGADGDVDMDGEEEDMVEVEEGEDAAAEDVEDDPLARAQHHHARSFERSQPRLEDTVPPRLRYSFRQLLDRERGHAHNQSRSHSGSGSKSASRSPSPVSRRERPAPPDSGKTATVASSRGSRRREEDESFDKELLRSQSRSRSRSPLSAVHDGEGDGEDDGEGEDELDVEDDFELSPERDDDRDGRSRDGPSAEEYAAGVVSCDGCGARVPFRDPKTGQFTLRLWDEHRDACRARHPSSPYSREREQLPQVQAQRPTSSPYARTHALPPPSSHHPSYDRSLPAPYSRSSYAPGTRDAYAGAAVRTAYAGNGHPHPHPSHSHPSFSLPPAPHPYTSYYAPSSHPGVPSSIPSLPSSNAAAAPLKKRRAKRTEDERIAYLRADPYVAQFEAYRVLCASCNKWIRLRPNSTYCSIPWDAHRKSCLGKRAYANQRTASAAETRSSLLSQDPDARMFDAERVLCAHCDTWVRIPVDVAEGGMRGAAESLRDWYEHRESCRIRGVNVAAAASVLQPPLTLGAGYRTPGPAMGSPPSHHYAPRPSYVGHGYSSMSMLSSKSRAPAPSLGTLPPPHFPPTHHSQTTHQVQSHHTHSRSHPSSNSPFQSPAAVFASSNGPATAPAHVSRELGDSAQLRPGDIGSPYATPTSLGGSYASGPDMSPSPAPDSDFDRERSVDGERARDRGSTSSTPAPGTATATASRGRSVSGSPQMEAKELKEKAERRRESEGQLGRADVRFPRVYDEREDRKRAYEMEFENDREYERERERRHGYANYTRARAHTQYSHHPYAHARPSPPHAYTHLNPIYGAGSPRSKLSYAPHAGDREREKRYFDEYDERTARFHESSATFPAVGQTLVRPSIRRTLSADDVDAVDVDMEERERMLAVKERAEREKEREKKAPKEEDVEMSHETDDTLAPVIATSNLRAGHSKVSPISPPHSRKPSSTSSTSGSKRADLATTTGRVAFLSHSITHLLTTTYDPTLGDTLTVSALLNYLNAAIPEGRGVSEFDLGEVCRGVGRLSREGRGVRVEGDVVRLVE